MCGLEAYYLARAFTESEVYVCDDDDGDDDNDFFGFKNSRIL